MILISPFDRRIGLGACAILAASLILTLIYSIWQWHDDWILVHQHIAARPAIARFDKTTKIIAAIPNEHLFGQSFSKLGEVPITNLQLRVTGIIKATNEQNGDISYAIISIAEQPGKVYRVGDSLQGVKIYAITPNAVILENNQHLEKLPLPREPLVFKPLNPKEHW